MTISRSQSNLTPKRLVWIFEHLQRPCGNDAISTTYSPSCPQGDRKSVANFVTKIWAKHHKRWSNDSFFSLFLLSLFISSFFSVLLPLSFFSVKKFSFFFLASDRQRTANAQPTDLWSSFGCKIDPSHLDCSENWRTTFDLLPKLDFQKKNDNKEKKEEKKPFLHVSLFIYIFVTLSQYSLFFSTDLHVYRYFFSWTLLRDSWSIWNLVKSRT